jgi:hypothetical protein
MLSRSRWGVVVFSVIALALGAPIACQAGNVNLVTNGSFEINTGIGQIGWNTSVSGWTTPGWPASFDYLFSPSTVGVVGLHAAHGAVGQVSLWGPQNGVNNGFTASPDGGDFVGLDGYYIKTSGPYAGNHDGPISQTISGLIVGHQYQLGFDWAASEQVNFVSTTTQYLHVSLGSDTADTTPLTIPGKGFSGWVHATMNFTASSTSEVLSFLAVGNKPAPPFTLLDGVTLFDTTVSVSGHPATQSTPEPSTMLASFLSFAVFGAAWGYKRLKRPAVTV